MINTLIKMFNNEMNEAIEYNIKKKIDICSNSYHYDYTTLKTSSST